MSSSGVRHTVGRHCPYWAADESSTNPRSQATTTDSSSNSTHHHAGRYHLSTPIRSANAPSRAISVKRCLTTWLAADIEELTLPMGVGGCSFALNLVTSASSTVVDIA